jgi:hypothetical protein
MRPTSRFKRAAATPLTLLVAAAALSCLVASAGAEISQKDGARVAVTGTMTPTKLPRTETAPIGVSVSGKITPTNKGELPRLSKIAIAINRHGKLDRKGLPLCRMGHINPSTTSEALQACRSSLVGEGSFSANVKIPEQSPFPSLGKVLAFNGRLRGKPAIFAHIYGTKPVPTSYVLPFSITETKGTYGTVLEASLPQITGEWGYVTGIALNLDRQFTSHGKQRTYLAASCPAPKGADQAGFPLAKTTFAFDGGLALSSILNRSCKVK